MSDYTREDLERDIETAMDIDYDNAAHDAANRIRTAFERLEAENGRLLSERGDWLKATDLRANTYAEMLAECERGVERLEAENTAYRERDEWLCEKCNTVYPYSSLVGNLKVFCPKCNVPTFPKWQVERKRLEAENAELRTILAKHDERGIIR